MWRFYASLQANLWVKRQDSPTRRGPSRRSVVAQQTARTLSPATSPSLSLLERSSISFREAQSYYKTSTPWKGWAIGVGLARPYYLGLCAEAYGKGGQPAEGGRML